MLWKHLRPFSKASFLRLLAPTSFPSLVVSLGEDPFWPQVGEL